MIPAGHPAAGTAGNALPKLPLQSHFHANVTSIKNWEVQCRLQAGIAAEYVGFGNKSHFFPHSFELPGAPAAPLTLSSTRCSCQPRIHEWGSSSSPSSGNSQPSFPSFCPFSLEYHPWSVPMATGSCGGTATLPARLHPTIPTSHSHWDESPGGIWEWDIQEGWRGSSGANSIRIPVGGAPCPIPGFTCQQRDEDHPHHHPSALLSMISLLIKWELLQLGGVPILFPFPFLSHSHSYSHSLPALFDLPGAEQLFPNLWHSSGKCWEYPGGRAWIQGGCRVQIFQKIPKSAGKQV